MHGNMNVKLKRHVSFPERNLSNLIQTKISFNALP